MITREVVVYLQQYFPRQAIDIKESVQLLVAVLDETMDSISDKASSISKGRQRDLQEAKMHYSQLENMLPIVNKLLEITELLEPAQGLADIDTADTQREPKNYADYVVDQAIAHTLYEDYTHKRPYAFELRDYRREVKDWKDVFLSTCEYLAESNPELFKSFADNPDMNGRKVQYFSDVRHPSMRAPRHLESVGIYVETVFSANHIRNVIVNMLRQYKLPLADFRIYLRADYSDMPR